MEQVSNDYTHCKLIDLGGHQQHGPFAVAQLAYHPEDPHMQPRLFLLQRDGTWIDEFALSAEAADEQFDIIYESAHAAMTRLSALPPRPVIEQIEVTHEQMQAYIERLRSAGDGHGVLTRFVQQWKAKSRED